MKNKKSFIEDFSLMFVILSVVFVVLFDVALAQQDVNQQATESQEIFPESWKKRTLEEKYIKLYIKLTGMNLDLESKKYFLRLKEFGNKFPFAGIGMRTASRLQTRCPCRHRQFRLRIDARD